jgi:hypothetical protein
VKIRHYGLLSNRQRQERLARVRVALGVPPTPVVTESAAQPTDATEPRLRCPHCGALALIWIEEIPRPNRRAQVLVIDTS